MQQTITPNGMCKLTADSGHKIVYDGDLSTATSTAYLGKGDSPGNYSEVTDAAVSDWQEQQRQVAVMYQDDMSESFEE